MLREVSAGRPPRARTCGNYVTRCPPGIDARLRDAHERRATSRELLEQIVERFPRVTRRRICRAARRSRRRGCRAGLPLDGRPRRHRRTGIARVFRRHARGDLVALRALPPRARIERHALDAAVQIDAAPPARVQQPDGDRQQVAAPRAPEHFVGGHQIRRFRTSLVLQDTPGRPLFGWRGVAARLPLARVVLIPALPIFPIAHDAGRPLILT